MFGLAIWTSVNFLSLSVSRRRARLDAGVFAQADDGGGPAIGGDLIVEQDLEALKDLGARVAIRHLVVFGRNWNSGASAPCCES